MNEVLLIMMAEIIFILVLLLVTLLFVGWKRKRSNHDALEQLLDSMTEQEGERKAALVEYLTGRQKLEKQQADELCEDFVEAEKRFMYLFLEQQMKQKPVNGFYRDLCELLDNYLDLLPQQPTPATAPAPAPVAEADDKPPKKMPAAETDWDEAFAELGLDQNGWREDGSNPKSKP